MKSELDKLINMARRIKQLETEANEADVTLRTYVESQLAELKGPTVGRYFATQVLLQEIKRVLQERLFDAATKDVGGIYD